ncbi:VOC family protein [Marininema halotolerans]|uniref:VOC family protein n=1 Tax=Marininema halotolerans TaxID=1155944 RepID=UPI000B899471|nr:VOC family protein [Marininema halotolerans]
MRVRGFNHITIRVANLENSLDFYEGTLQMNVVHRGRRDAYLEWGDAWICLIEKREAVRGSDQTIGVDHVAFSIAEEDFSEAVQRLQAFHVHIVRGPEERGGGHVINFLDPDHTQLELFTGTLEERMKIWV